MRRIVLLLLCGVGLWSCSGTARYLGPTTQGYTFRASAFPDEIFLPSDLVSPEEFPTSATVLVQVRDRNQAPVEGVPVTFQYAGSECRGVLTLSAQQAVTRMISASDIKNRRVPCPKSRLQKGRVAMPMGKLYRTTAPRYSQAKHGTLSPRSVQQ